MFPCLDFDEEDLVIGSGGAGKSTFARRLGKILKLEVIHLDSLYWSPGWVEMAVYQIRLGLPAQEKARRMLEELKFYSQTKAVIILRSHTEIQRFLTNQVKSK